jgi:hypothetical protein
MVGPRGGGAGGSSTGSPTISAALRAVEAPEVETGAKAETDWAAVAAKMMEAEIFILIVFLFAYLFESFRGFEL